MTSHLKSIVEPHMGKSLGVFVAATEPCIGISRGPPAENRQAVRITPDLLDQVELPESYAFAILLCGNDTTEVIAAYAVTHQLPADRFHFYYTAGTNIAAAMQPWREADLEVYSFHEVKTWGQLNQHFGNHWNNLIHDDYCKTPGCRRR